MDYNKLIETRYKSVHILTLKYNNWPEYSWWSKTGVRKMETRTTHTLCVHALCASNHTRVICIVTADSSTPYYYIYVIT